MIIMQVKEGENIERALKKFRARQYFTKPSISKRERMAHAIYVEKLHREEAE